MTSKPLGKRLAERGNMLPTAVVQLTEHRHCICGKAYAVPGYKLMVSFRSRLGKGSSYASLSEVKLSLNCMNLPRICREIHTKVEACSACFVESNEQMNLFPEFVPRVLSMGASGREAPGMEERILDTPVRLNGKASVVPTPLDAF